jgi:hypothetical protein
VEKHLQKVIFKVLFDIVTSGGLETSECKSWLGKRIYTLENLISAFELIDTVWICCCPGQSVIYCRLKTGS